MTIQTCLEAQLANGAEVEMAEAPFIVNISINRMNFGDVWVTFRDANGQDEQQGPRNSGQAPNPLQFSFLPRGGTVGGQCGWTIRVAKTNLNDPHVDVDVEIVQAGTLRYAGPYVCLNDPLPAKGIEINDYVKLVAL